MGQNTWPEGLLFLKKIYESASDEEGDEFIAPDLIPLVGEVIPGEKQVVEVTFETTPIKDTTVVYQLALIKGTSLLHYFGSPLTVQLCVPKPDAVEEHKNTN